MKPFVYCLGLLLTVSIQLRAQNTFAVAEGENAPQGRQITQNGSVTPGDIVPDRIGFSLANSSASDLLESANQGGFSYEISDRTQFSYSDFPGEIVLSVYHTPW